MDPNLTPEGFQKEFNRLSAVNPQEGYRYAKTVLARKRIKNPQTRQLAAYYEAMDLFYQARYPEAEALLKTFLFSYEKYPFKPFYVDCFIILAALMFFKKRYYLSIFFGQQALALAEEKKLPDRYSTIYSNLAAPYREIKDYDRCLLCLNRALNYVGDEADPALKASLIYNQAAILLTMGRYLESRERLEALEALIAPLPVKPPFLNFLPLCKAEVALSLHEESNLHELAMDFLHSPLRSDPEATSFILEDDEDLYLLLVKSGLYEDAKLYLASIQKAEEAAPSLATELFIAKAEQAEALRTKDGEGLAKANAALAKLYEAQQESYTKDFAEITKLHFDFVRMESAYQKVTKRASRYKEESDTDALTGLMSRRALEKEKARVPLLAKKGKYLVLALLDYDHFKSINDNYGYQVGDLALRLGGQFFKGYGSVTRRIFRYGGDEVVFLWSVDSFEAIAPFFKEIQAGLAAVDLRTSSGTKVPLSCCIGYTVYPSEAYPAFPVALKKANEAIHEAKTSGRGNIVGKD